jgi:threonine/homoserine/homoserine lactone efflux protein
MLSILLIFSLTFGISFLGSVHPGPVNLSVVQATLRRDYRTGLWLAAGGCVPEIIYGLLAVQGVKLFEQWPGLFGALRIAIVPVLLGLGVLTIVRSYWPGASQPEVNPDTGGHYSFGRGFVLSLLNPQLLAFWVVILVWYHGHPLLRVSTVGRQLAFVAGTSLGAFGILWVYAWLVRRHRARINRYLQAERFDRAMGWGFVGLALWQAANLWVF